MSDLLYGAAFYTSIPVARVPERFVSGLERSGIDPRSTDTYESIGPSSDREYEFAFPFHDSRITAIYTTKSNREPGEPAARLSTITHSVDPKWSDNAAEYTSRMNDVLELLCRLAMSLETDYVAFLNVREQSTDATPAGESIPETVSEPPAIGIYSPAVLDGFGGVEGVTDSPWYTAELTDGRTVVITTEQPWADAGWQPPTDAPYLDHT